MGALGALVGAECSLEFAAAVGADVHVLSVIDTSPFDGLSSLLKPGMKTETNVDTETEISTTTTTASHTHAQQAALERVNGCRNRRQHGVGASAREPTTAVEYVPLSSHRSLHRGGRNCCHRHGNERLCGVITNGVLLAFNRRIRWSFARGLLRFRR